MRLLLVLLFISNFSFAQKSKQQIAFHYYSNGEYKKAITIYNDLIEENFSVSYYIPYIQSFIKLDDYKSAESLAKRFSKKYPKNLSYQIDIGVSQRKSGYIKKSERTIKKVYDRIGKSRSQAINLANTFRRYEMIEASLKVYSISEKYNSQNNFRNEKAALYAQLGKSDLMLVEYFQNLKYNPRNKSFVIGKIQKYIDNDGIKSDKNYQLVKKILLPFVREENDRTDFTEILIWLFILDLKLTP